MSGAATEHTALPTVRGRSIKREIATGTRFPGSSVKTSRKLKITVKTRNNGCQGTNRFYLL